MTLRIIHTADWHIGASRNLPNYLKRQEDALDELTRKTKKYEPDIFIITGDMFDSNTPREEERCLIVSTLTNLLVQNPNMYMLIVGGNHDWDKQNNSMLDSIDISYKIAGTRFKVVSKETEIVKIKKSNFLCIPCEQNYTKEKLRKIVKKYHKGTSGDFYVCMHECFKSFNDLGKQLGKESLPKLAFVKCWMLGDIHKHQFLLDNAWYSGSLLQTNFGEKPNKGFVLVDDGEPTFVRIKSPTKLVTINQGDEVPENCLVKYRITDVSSVNKCELPDNVVMFGSDIKPAEVDTSLLTDDVTEGLSEFLATKFGYSKKMQRKSVEYINDLLNT